MARETRIMELLPQQEAKSIWLGRRNNPVWLWL